MRSRVSIIGIRRRGNFRLAERDQNRAIPNTLPKNSDSRTTQAVEISQVRITTLRMIGLLASDKVSQLGKQGDLNRIKQMVENAPINLLYADLDLRIQYMNHKA